MTIKVELSSEMEARLKLKRGRLVLLWKSTPSAYFSRRSTPRRNPVPGQARTNFGGSWMLQ